MKFLYIINTSDEPNNVIMNHAVFARDAGWTPVFVFPYRLNSNNLTNFYSDFDVIYLNLTFKVNSWHNYFVSLILYCFYITKYFLFKSSCNNFLAVDLTGVIVCILLKIKNIKLHVLINDNFSARYKLKKIPYQILKKFEQFCYKLLCNTCIFPDKTRYILLGSPLLKNVYYIPNILNDSYAPRYIGNTNSKLVIMLCGWLVLSRGLNILPELLLKTNDNIEFLLIGSGDEDAIINLIKSKRVKYIGHISREDNLDYMKSVDINMAFYDPNILINRYALPQKIYDSIMIGCPLFVNSEVEISVELESHQVCITSEYYDIQKISNKLNYLSNNKIKLNEMSLAVTRYALKSFNYQKTKDDGISMYKKLL